MDYFCTYFDRNYLSRGLALYRSLQEHCPEFKLWVLCMDDETHEALTQLDLPEVEPIALQDFEQGDAPLLQAKQNRSLVEYYFTCTPSLPLFILNNFPEVNLITYLDADIFFFADPAPIYGEIADCSIAIIAHGFRPELKNLEIWGVYNVGWLSFRRDQNALTCLHWWRERCIEWCYDRAEDGRFADQKYLDDWPVRFQGVGVLAHKGANLAPWNLANYEVRKDRDGVYVDDHPLVFYHFHGFKPVKSWIYSLSIDQYKAKLSLAILQHIYQPYIHTLSEATKQIMPFVHFADAPTSLRGQPMNAFLRRRDSWLPLLRVGRKLEETLRVCVCVLARRYVCVVNGHVI